MTLSLLSREFTECQSINYDKFMDLKKGKESFLVMSSNGRIKRRRRLQKTGKSVMIMRSMRL